MLVKMNNNNNNNNNSRNNHNNHKVNFLFFLFLFFSPLKMKLTYYLGQKKVKSLLGAALRGQGQPQSQQSQQPSGNTTPQKRQRDEEHQQTSIKGGAQKRKVEDNEK